MTPRHTHRPTDAPKGCAVCGRPAPFFCDYRQRREDRLGTCGKPLCPDHAIEKRGGRHWCLEHGEAGAAPSQAREATP